MPLAKDAIRRTELNWQKYDERATVFSDEKGIVRRLFRHPLFEATEVLRSKGEPIAVEGTLPVACLRVNVFERKSTRHANILPYDATEKRDWAKENVPRYMEQDE